MLIIFLISKLYHILINYDIGNIANNVIKYVVKNANYFCF